MNQYTELPGAIHALAAKSRLIRHKDVCAALPFSTEECTALLDKLVGGGLLLRTRTRTGEYFYWFPQKFGQEQAQSD